MRKKLEIIFKPRGPADSDGNLLEQGAIVLDWLPNGDPVYVDTPYGAIGIKWGNSGIWEPAPKGMTKEGAEKHGINMFFKYFGQRLNPGNIEI